MVLAGQRRVSPSKGNGVCRQLLERTGCLDAVRKQASLRSVPTRSAFSDLAPATYEASRTHALAGSMVCRYPSTVQQANGNGDSLTRSAKPQKRLMAIVVADVVRFGSLTEGEVGLFSVTLLPECLASARNYGAAYCNTWGDAIIAFFDSVGEGLDYALTLRDLFRNREWGSGPEDTFNEPLAIRIALHSADVYIAPDDNVPGGQIFGTQISLVARIEPITIPNEVFASEAAVAQLKAQRRSKVVFRNLGAISLPKEDREETIFWVRRAGESSKLPTLAVSRRIQVLPSTEAALTDIARRSQRLHSVRIAVLNGAVSLRFVLGACEERLARSCNLKVLAYDPDPTKLRATELADGSRRTYLEQLQRKVARATFRGSRSCRVHSPRIGVRCMAK